MTYCFRVRFALGLHVRISTKSDELVLAIGAADGESVVLRSRDPGVELGEAQNLVLRGTGYRTEEDAERAAYEWLARLRVAFARLRIGADFGGRGPTSAFTEYGLRMFESSSGERVLNDVHGVMVFKCEPQPRFVSQGVDFHVGKPAEQLVDLVRRARSRRAIPGEREELAFGLFSTSFFEYSADARFMTLMMAVETLIDQQPRPDEAIAHVECLIASTEASAISDEERLPLLGALRGLRRESVRKAGRRLAQSLGDRIYMDDSATKFFDRCYAMRGALVHGGYPRPQWADVGAHAAALEQFVGDLLSAAAFEDDERDP